MSEPYFNERPPRLYVKGLPEEERDAADTLFFLILDLDKYACNFEAAINLFEFARAEALTAGHNQAVQWSFIAARDGAMTIYHFGQALQHMRNTLGLCPTVKSLVDPRVLRLAGKKFNSRFRDYESLRHAVAHSGDFWRQGVDVIRNAMKKLRVGPFVLVSKNAHVVIRESLLDRRFTTTIEGRQVSYEISGETLKNLVGIKDEIFSAFRPAEKRLAELASKTDP